MVASNHHLAEVRVSFRGLSKCDLSEPEDRDCEDHHVPSPCRESSKEPHEDAHAKEREEARAFAASDELGLGERSIHRDASTHALPPPPKDGTDRPEVPEEDRKEGREEEHPDEASLFVLGDHHGSTAEESPNLPMMVVERAQTPPKMRPAIARRPPKLSKPSPRM